MGYISSLAQIHPSAWVSPAAIIYDNVTIGANSYVGDFSVIGAPPEHREFWNGETPGVSIGENVRITTHVTVDAGTTGMTYIFDNVTLLAKSHVGHDATIGRGSTVSCGAMIGGHTHIGEDCNIGLNAVIHQRQFIKDGCMVGMGAVVTKGLVTESYSKYVGNPARWLSINHKP
jgi:UDP-N-acetylglucosamine acyltransferase